MPKRKSIFDIDDPEAYKRWSAPDTPTTILTKEVLRNGMRLFIRHGLSEGMTEDQLAEFIEDIFPGLFDE